MLFLAERRSPLLLLCLEISKSAVSMLTLEILSNIILAVALNSSKVNIPSVSSRCAFFTAALTHCAHIDAAHPKSTPATPESSINAPTTPTQSLANATAHSSVTPRTPCASKARKHSEIFVSNDPPHRHDNNANNLVELARSPSDADASASNSSEITPSGTTPSIDNPNLPSAFVTATIGNVVGYPSFSPLRPHPLKAQISSTSSSIGVYLHADFACTPAIVDSVNRWSILLLFFFSSFLRLASRSFRAMRSNDARRLQLGFWIFVFGKI